MIIAIVVNEQLTYRVRISPVEGTFLSSRQLRLLLAPCSLMTRKATLAASLIPAAAVTGSQPSSRRSRLTFGPGASRASLSTSADLPAFSHPSSQSNARHFKPLPKPVKEKVEKKNNCNRNKTKREPSWRTRKRLEEEEAERKKREGPLDEAEEGEYDQHGIWQAKQPQSDWDMEARGR